MAQSTPKVVVFTHPAFGVFGVGLFIASRIYSFIQNTYKLNYQAVA